MAKFAQFNFTSLRLKYQISIAGLDLRFNTTKFDQKMIRKKIRDLILRKETQITHVHIDVDDQSMGWPVTQRGKTLRPTLRPFKVTQQFAISFSYFSIFWDISTLILSIGINFCQLGIFLENLNTFNFGQILRFADIFPSFPRIWLLEHSKLYLTSLRSIW